MWRILKTGEFERRYKRYDKKKRQQLLAVTNNLARFVTLLNAGRKPKPLAYGFLRDEGLGILRISEAGSAARVAATRLYVYPDAEREDLYLLTIGDKNSQSDDIESCKRFVKKLRADQDLEGGRGHDDQDAGEGEEADAQEDDG